MKLDEGKADYTLVPVQILDAVEAVREYGVKKYSAQDWRREYGGQL